MSAKVPPEVIDSQGRVVRLGRRLGQGGEGAVFEVASNDNTVAKIYHSPLSPERAAKIQAMTKIRNEQIEKLTAWPSNLLTLRSGQPIGLTMPKVEGHKDAHHLYSPKSRRTDFQRANWQFLIRSASNLARAFASVHEAGCVIGDVNPGGVQIAQDARIRLIDCDSFQLSYGGQRFLCHVGVPHFTPPELQGRDFTGIVRTPNHDNFGLAVLIFLLLFMGRHPFAGKYLGTGEMPIEKAIEEYRFVYGSRRAALGMEQPPGTPALPVVSEEVAFLFERAFARESVAGTRPSAREWVAGLDALEKKLRQCSANPGHVHVATLAACPWCQMEGATGISLFPLAMPQWNAGFFGIDELWKQVAAVPHPGHPSVIEDPQLMLSLRPSAEVEKIKDRSVQRIWTCFAAVVPIVCGALAINPALRILLIASGILAPIIVYRLLAKGSEIEALVRRKNDLHQAYIQAANEYAARAGPQPFELKRAELDSTRKSLENLASLRLVKLNELKARLRDTQLEHFLDRYKIPPRGISGIGAARKATLESYGIETAADIVSHRLARVPGIGPARQAALERWRRSIESKFKFDPSRGIDPQDQAKVEQEIFVNRQNLVAQFHKGLLELKQTGNQIAWARATLRENAESAYRHYAQAYVDAKAVGR